MTLGLLCACAAPVSRSVPHGLLSPQAFELAGEIYQAELRGDLNAGVLSLTRDGVAFGYDEGLASKRAAEAFCAIEGFSLSPAALGRFSGGAWLFDGGCV